MFTWHCASSKDVETVQQNSEVDLETNQIFPYGELLKDVSLEEITILLFQVLRFSWICHDFEFKGWHGNQTHLDEGISLQTFGVLDCDF